MFEIQDEEKTIHTGSEEEMQLAYIVMVWNEKTLHQMFQESKLAELKEKYRRPTKGKVKMVPHESIRKQDQGNQAKD